MYKKPGPWKSVVRSRGYKPAKGRRSIRQRAITRTELANGGEEWKDERGRFNREDGPARIVRYSNGNIKEEAWYRDGKMNRDGDQPAAIQYYESGAKKFDFWVKDSKKHRVDKPAAIQYYQSGKVQTIAYYIEDKLHREGGPAYEEFYRVGVLGRVVWSINGLKHRLDGPAYEEFYRVGSPKVIEWRKNDKKHRLDGPAFEEFYENGNIKEEAWYVDGVASRTDGPAKISYDVNRKVISERWYVNNVPRNPDLSQPTEIQYYANGNIKSKEWTDERGQNYRVADALIHVYTFAELEPLERILEEVGDENSFIVGGEEDYTIIQVKHGRAKSDILTSLDEASISYKQQYTEDIVQFIKYYENGKLETLFWNDYNNESFEVSRRNDDSNSKSSDRYIKGDYEVERDYDNSENLIEDRSYILGDLEDREMFILHSYDDEPSVVQYDNLGRKVKESWHTEGRRDRPDDLPAVIIYSPPGEVHQEEWYIEGDRGRGDDDDPAIIEYYDVENNIVKRKEWFINGRHRTKSRGGPGIVEYDAEGNVVREIYFDERGEEDLEIREDYPIQDPNPVCDTLFQPRAESTAEFTARINNLRSECYKIETSPDCDDYPRSVFVSVARSTVIDRQVPTLRVDRKRELEAAFKSNLPLDHYMRNYYIVINDEPGIDAGGLRRQFFNSVCRQAINLFSYLNINSEDRRVYISEDSNEELLKKLNKDGQEFVEEDILPLYTFVGKLFVHALINEYSTEIPLSRVLLKAMVDADNSLATNDLLLYFLLETDIKNIIGQAYDYGLGEEYLIETADAVYGISNTQMKSRADAFINGFSILNSRLSQAKILPAELFRRICITNITPEKFDYFVQNSVQFINTSLEQKKFIIDSLSSDVVGPFTRNLEFDEPVGEGNDRIIAFYKLLLVFWAENNTIKPKVEYRITIDPAISEGAAFFPHTCFQDLTVNPSIINAGPPINSDNIDSKVFFLDQLWASVQGQGGSFTRA